MADKVSSSAKDATGGLQQNAQGVTGSILGKISGITEWIKTKGMGFVDRIFPPEQRSEFLAKLQAFALKNPKLSTFLGMNLVLTGIPLGLFIIFSITVFIFALVVGLLVGLLAAVFFTLFCVGVALCFVLPFVFFTTLTAVFLFLWGLGGYYLLRWASGASTDGKDGQAPEGQAIGDKLNKLTGGRLTGFMDSARSEQAKGDISGFSDKHTRPESNDNKKGGGGTNKANGSGVAEKTARQTQQQVGDAASKATSASGLDGVQKGTANTKGTVKGGLSGTTGVDVPV